MIHGLDTGYLVAAELKEHSWHLSAREQLKQFVEAGDTFALAPQVLAEFIHIVSDPKRFSNALSVDDARTLAQKWWTAAEVRQVFPDVETITKFFEWHQQFQLGRKRLLDTLLAATYWRAGAVSVLTTDADDFDTFGVFSCIGPKPLPPATTTHPSGSSK